MAKRFTLVSYNEDSLLLGGLIDLEDVPSIVELQEYITTVSSYESVNIGVAYMAFIGDINEPIEDATQEELEIIDENFEEMEENEDLVVLDVFEFKVSGTMEDKIVEDIEY